MQNVLPCSVLHKCYMTACMQGDRLQHLCCKCTEIKCSFALLQVLRLQRVKLIFLDVYCSVNRHNQTRNCSTTLGIAY